MFLLPHLQINIYTTKINPVDEPLHLTLVDLLHNLALKYNIKVVRLMISCGSCHTMLVISSQKSMEQIEMTHGTILKPIITSH
jgi:hypothetical protein